MTSASDTVVADDLRIERHGTVVVTEISRPPSNFFDSDLLTRLANCWEALDRDRDCRAIVLAADGKTFCAGNQYAGRRDPDAPASPPGTSIYAAARRLFATRKPVVAAIQGAAVGGGMGLALVADFRIVSPEARLWPNFSRLGFHAGFGLSATLPRLVGAQMAALLLYTGRRVAGAEAARIGLADELVDAENLRDRAIALAGEVASSAPLAVQSMRETLRRELRANIAATLDREFSEQDWQRETSDFAEGKSAMAERRPPDFTGR